MSRIKVIKKLIALLMSICFIVIGCTPASSTEETGGVSVANDSVKIGFSQVGAESDWRRANMESIQSSLSEEKGYQLFVEDGQQKQSNQALAIRRFIQQGVDYIVVAPATEVGWDNVLKEAKKAEIPVILVDRKINVEDASLYTCWVGSDFRLEADKLTAWIHKYTQDMGIKGEDLNIADLQGTLGATAQIGRTEGLAAAAQSYGWNIVASADGDFTQTKGREVATRILDENKDINILYCENDNMALGALEAIEIAGRKAGSNIKKGEIMVVSFDGVSREAMEMALEGKISCIAECYPMHGPNVCRAIEMLEMGKTPQRESYVSEGLYCADSRITQVSVGGNDYPVTVITQDWLDNRDINKEK